MAGGGSDGSVLLARPWRDVGIEVAALSGFFCLVTWLVFFAPHGLELAQSVERLRSVGGEVLTQIGWGLGAYIPTMLGFYAIVAGGQLLGGDVAAAKVRRVLGFTSELMFSALFPAVVVVALFAAVSPGKAGALLVILPVTGVMLFLVLQLGGFLVPDPEAWLASTRASRLAWKARLTMLRARSRRPVTLVFLVNLAVPTLIWYGALTPFWRYSDTLRWLAVFALLAFLCVFAGWGAVFLSGTRPTADRLTRWAPCAFAALPYAGIVALGVVLAAAGFPWEGGVLAAPLLLLLVSTVRLNQPGPAWLRNWSLWGAGTTSAARSTVRALRRSTAQLRQLEALEAARTSRLPRDALTLRIRRVLSLQPKASRPEG